MSAIRLLSIAALCLWATVAAPPPAGATDKLATLGMVTGPKTGTYVAFGKDIAGQAKKAGIDIAVKPSSGSIDNIKRITGTEENAALGIVQSDVLGFLKRSKNPESLATAQKLRMVLPFYREEVHVLARREVGSFADLAGKRVVVGSEGSGSMLTSVNLFSLLGIKPAKMYQVEPPEGIVAVLNNRADAMVFVGGKPVRLFKNLEEVAGIAKGPLAGKMQEVHLLPLDDPRLTQEYSAASITPEDYAYVEQLVPTVAVNAMLVSYDFTRKNTAYYRQRCAALGKVTQSIRDNLESLKSSGHPKWREVDLQADVLSWQRDECALPAPVVAGNALSEKDAASLEADLLRIVTTGER